MTTKKEGLKISKEFFAECRAHNISLCHFKSNSHLIAALAGETDLDVLVSDKDQEKFYCLMTAMRFCKIVSPSERQLPGVFDYLGFDESTGELIHLHVHFKLILGQKYVKNHHLPIEQLILSDLRLLHSTPIPSAEMELFILCLRANLKFDNKDVLRVLLGRRPEIFPNSILEEFKFLQKNVNREKFNRVIAESGIALCQITMLNFLDAVEKRHLNLKLLLKTRKHVTNSMKPFRRYRPIVCAWRLVWSVIRSSRYGFRFFPIKRKTLPQSGKVFAVVGADGSGKTTLCKDLLGWLSWKVDTHRVYLGKQRTFEIKLVRRTQKISLFLSMHGYQNLSRKTYKILNEIYWVLVARRRWRVALKAKKLAIAGKIVIAERYPLPEFFGMVMPMDGPRIRAENDGMSSAMSKREEKYYRLISPWT